MTTNEKTPQDPSALSDFELDRAIQRLIDAIGGSGSNEDAQDLVTLVREQRQRQRRAKIRLGEFLRQRDMRNRSYRMRNSEPKDLIDVVHADKFGRRAGLRFSDIETLAPWVQRDTEAAFWVEQDRRLAVVLAANPKLTDKQKATLEQIAHQERSVSHSSRYGISYGALDGRVVNGLRTRGLIESWSYGNDFGQSNFLIIANPDAEKK